MFFVARDSLPIFTELKYISEVKRFSMTLMFLTDKEKTGRFFLLLGIDRLYDSV